jgi:hypothetical protein
MRLHSSNSAKPGNNRIESRLANRIRVLRLIYSKIPYSQRRLILETKLRASTISNIIGELLDAKIVVGGDSPESGRVGPRETFLKVAPEAAYAVGINLQARSQEMRLLDGSGSVIAEDAIELPWSERMQERLPERVAALVKTAGLDLEDLGGLCFAVPGIADNDTGRIVYSRVLDAADFPLREQVGAQLGVPVYVDRNVISGGYFERYSRPENVVSNSAYLYLDRMGSGQKMSDLSAGMALTLNGEIYRGVNHAAGELDAVLLPGDRGLGNRLRSADLFANLGSHLASTVNLLDIEELVVAADQQVLSKPDFKHFHDALFAALIPISNRKFRLLHSTEGTEGMARGAALQVLHQTIEGKLRSKIMKRPN